MFKQVNLIKLKNPKKPSMKRIALIKLLFWIKQPWGKTLRWPKVGYKKKDGSTPKLAYEPKWWSRRKTLLRKRKTFA